MMDKRKDRKQASITTAQIDGNVIQKQQIQNEMGTVDTTIQNTQIGIEDMRRKQDEIRNQSNLSPDQMDQEVEALEAQIKAQLGTIKGQQMQKQQMGQREKSIPVPGENQEILTRDEKQPTSPVAPAVPPVGGDAPDALGAPQAPRAMASISSRNIDWMTWKR